MDGALPSTVTGRDFFERARSRLTLDVPAALMRPRRARNPRRSRSRSGHVGARRRRRDPPGRRAGAGGRPSGADRAADLAHRRAAEPRRADRVSRRQDRDERHDAAAAALREAHEEVGLERALVDPIGYLDLYLTFSGFRVLPAVARIDPAFRATLNPTEVEDVFEVPLAFLMDVQNHTLYTQRAEGVVRRYYAMPFGERYIWGVTAGILRNLYERIYQT